MNKYVCTFGLGDKNKGKYQPIVAEDEDAARELMFENYGSQWAFNYTEEAFLVGLERGYFGKLEPLKTIKQGGSDHD